MTLEQFCIAHGIILNRPPRIGVWERYPTEDHPHKRNGAVKYLGDCAFIQNHAMDSEVAVWKPDSLVEYNRDDYKQAHQEAEAERKRMQREAAYRAIEIVSRCVTGKHDYLRAKGFPDERGLIWCHDKTEHLIVPMRIAGAMVGAQMIDATGQKRFLTGQKSSGATFVMDNKGPDVLCEGYATGLSVRAALNAMKRLYRIHVCFSANNLHKIAASLTHALVVADNDASGTGETVAKKTGFPYWISPKVGQDFNDYHREHGLFKAAQSLTLSMSAR